MCWMLRFLPSASLARAIFVLRRLAKIALRSVRDAVIPAQVNQHPSGAGRSVNCERTEESGAVTAVYAKEATELNVLINLWPSLSGEQKAAVLELARDSSRVNHD